MGVTVVGSEVRASVFVVIVGVEVLVRFIKLVVASDEISLFVVVICNDADDELKGLVDKMAGSVVVTFSMLSLGLGAKPEVVLSPVLSAKPEVVGGVGTADVSALVTG